VLYQVSIEVDISVWTQVSVIEQVVVLIHISVMVDNSGSVSAVGIEGCKTGPPGGSRIVNGIVAELKGSEIAVTDGVAESTAFKWSTPSIGMSAAVE
jgi:hypothetical protein